MSYELLKAGLPPANDRMLTTCFLAALVHGIIILGVTFTASGNHAAEGDGPALEVVLVNDQAPSVANNPQGGLSGAAQPDRIGKYPEARARPHSPLLADGGQPSGHPGRRGSLGAAGRQRPRGR